MSHIDLGSIAVGVDFSKPNLAAIDYAAAEAGRRHSPLVLIHAIDPHISAQALTVTPHEYVAEAERELAECTDAVRRDHPDLEVRSELAHAGAAQALVAASQHARLVVVGSRGHGPFGQLLLGGVAWRVVSRATGPVIVVRPTEVAAPVGAGPVVVGVDSSEGSLAALEFAFDEAKARQVGLVAVNVWGPAHPDAGDINRLRLKDAADWQPRGESMADRVLAETLAKVQVRYPDVAVTQVVIHGLNAASALLEVAADKDADLVVVGARGHSAVTELVLGAVGVQLAHHADRAVAIVHS